MRIESAPGKKLNSLQSYAVMTVMAFFSVAFQAAMQNGVNPLGYITYVTSPTVWLFNFIPALTLMLFLFSLTGSLRVSFIAFNLPLTVFLLINEFKIFFRDEPFKPNDLSLITETRNMLENYKLQLNLKIILLIVLMIAVMVFVLRKIRNGKISAPKRIVGLVLSVAIAAASYLFVYSNKTIYENTSIAGNIYHETEVVANKGFMFFFLSSLKGSAVIPPEGYSKEKAEKILKEYAVDKNESVPNIIAIMSESFFDAQASEKIEFMPGMNPYEKYNGLKNESLYGNIFVPGFAGGTAQTEFEFLCGSNISLIDTSLPTVYKTHISGPAYGLTNELKSRGFKTIAIHPGHPWFYNRRNVYNYLGFDEFITAEDLPAGTEKKNYYIKDSVTAKLITDNYSKHLKENPGKGYFCFTVTIENHGPYSEKETGEPARLVRPAGLSDDEYNILENYMSNVYDAAELICDVAEFTETVDVPTVILFFGDHLPYFDSEYKDYEAIGYDIMSGTPESVLRQHTTPFVIYGNQAFRSERPEAEAKDAGLISSNFLISEMLEYIGADLSPYFRFTKELHEKVNVISSDIYIENGDIQKEDVSGENKQLLSDYGILQYYNLKDYKSE